MREEILRALYLGWLYAVSVGDVPEDSGEPPVPPGLGALTTAQLSLCEFLGIDPDFVSAAAASSPPSEESSTVSNGMSRWVAGISEAEAKDYVLLLIEGKSKEAERKAHRNFAAYLRDCGRIADVHPHRYGRSVSELLKEVEKAREKRIERESIEKVRRTGEQRKLRERYLCELAMDFGRHWKKAHELAERGTASAYDQARDLLVDLSEAYLLKQRQMEFLKEISRVRAAWVRRGALIKRLDNAGLG